MVNILCTWEGWNGMKLKKALIIIPILILSGCESSPTPTIAVPQTNTPLPQMAESVTPDAALTDVTETSTVESDLEETAMIFEVSSPSFGHQQPIPAKYSCYQDNISIPLEWTEPPEGTQSFALIIDDPDAPAGTWVHWVYFNIPKEKRSLPEGIPAMTKYDDGSVSGKNSWNKVGYGGPCPPYGTHRYFIKLYALDIPLALDPGVGKPAVISAMQKHILAQAEFYGTYTKK
jgi:Raf kinase inhibitor-like YbhB/YbcL family protein